MCLFRLIEHLIKETPVPTQLATVSLIKVKSCNALLRMLLMCIIAYLKSIRIYTFLILRTIDGTLCIYVSKDLRIRGYFSKPKGVRERRSLGNTALQTFVGFGVVYSLYRPATGWTVRVLTFWFGLEIFSSPHLSIRTLGPTQFPLYWTLGLFPLGKAV